MLQFLQTGKVLYILAGVCALGMFSKLVTSSLYKRLIKETGNMALTKNKNLKALKQRTENMVLLNHGIRNAQAYIEKQMYGFRFLRASLDSWDNLSLQAMILCFLVGGGAAFASYWCRSDSYYIVLYGSMGILSGLFLVFVDNGANIALKRQQLADSLVDYVENSPHFYKSVDNTGNGAETEKKSQGAAGILRPRLGEGGRKKNRGVLAAVAGDEGGQAFDQEKTGPRLRRLSIESGGTEDAAEAGAEAAHDGRAGKRFSVLSRKKEPEKEDAEKKPQGRETAGDSAEKPGGDELARSIEHLRQSLEQIAAGREEVSGREPVKKEPSGTGTIKGPGLERARRELDSEDIKLLGELLQEYLT